MSRLLLYRRYWDRVKERREKLRGATATAWNASTFPFFIDYWMNIPATIPEKLVFAELVQREVGFYFSWYIGDIPFTWVHERYRPDFILPDYRIIIEVYGVYWHTRPGMFEYDANRAGLLTAMGYKFYSLTDYEILRNVSDAVDTIPELRDPTIHSNMQMVGDRPIQPTAALRARMRRWPRQFAARYKKVLGSKAPVYPVRQVAMKGVPRTPTTPDFLFMEEYLDEGVWREYALKWYQWRDQQEWFRSRSKWWWYRYYHHMLPTREERKAERVQRP